MHHSFSGGECMSLHCVRRYVLPCPLPRLVLPIFVALTSLDTVSCGAELILVKIRIPASHVCRVWGRKSLRLPLPLHRHSAGARLLARWAAEGSATSIRASQYRAWCREYIDVEVTVF